MIHGLLSFVVFLIVSTHAYAANEINILTPEHGNRVRSRTLWLVASTTTDPKGMIARLKNKDTVKQIQGKIFETDGVFAFHALLNLEIGVNEVTVGRKALSILYTPRYQYEPVDKSREKKEVFQEYQRLFFHTSQKQARCSPCHGKETMNPRGKAHCFQCHGRYFSVEYIHGPMGAGLDGLAGGICLVCHDSDSTTSGFLPKFNGGRELCFSCHLEWEEIFRKILSRHTFSHCSVKEFECTTCHDPHGSPFRFQLPVEQKRMCYLCHEQKKILQGKNVHGALQSKGCDVCHDAHTSDYKYLLLGVEKDLCSTAECHPEFADINEHHPIRNHPVVGKFGPERRLTCSGCHNPHSSDFPFLLPGEKQSFCSKCHEDIRFFRSSDRGLPWKSQNGSQRRRR